MGRFVQRYYDPAIGRFLSVDPAASEFNRYNYANNNPYKFTDPDGRENVLGIVASLPYEDRFASKNDIAVRGAAQRTVDLTVRATIAGGTAEQKSNIAKWKVTVDAVHKVAPKTGGVAETRTGTTPDGKVRSVETTIAGGILDVANASGDVTLTQMKAPGGDAALLAVGTHEIGHSTLENRKLPGGPQKEANASQQAVKISGASPDVAKGSVKPCADCWPGGR